MNLQYKLNSDCEYPLQFGLDLNFSAVDLLFFYIRVSVIRSSYLSG